MHIKNILVPTDFTDCSIRALKFAIALAKKVEAEIQVVHALSLTISYSEVTVPQAYDYTEAQAFDRFNELKENLPELDTVTHSFLVNSAATAEVISDTALMRKTDLVIMGTSGAFGLDEFLFGTNAFNAIKSTDCPILVIPESANFTNPLSIGLAADYHEVPEKQVFDPLITLARIYGSQIHILNVSKSNKIGDQESQQAKKFEQYLKNIQHTYHFEIEQNVEKGINHYLSNHKIDLMAIVKRKHSLMEKIAKTSVLKKLVFHTHIPLLIMPDQPES
ncbi:MAG: universal stress protein [Reichenbachiella sp.]|uniref:universal stress protein n=1 Tax=Reichenbachiella sp. TaxID=2184521 RepID=UPI003267819E